MNYYLFLCFLMSCNSALVAQNKDTWTAFFSNDSIHIGYKDSRGIVQIEPKFMGYSSAHKFDNIIAVSEETDEGWKSYYLTKEGKEVGLGQLHIYDNGADCESEGFIRFRDPKTDKAGMFNSKGNIVIPAIYNDLTRVRNGMVVALRGAEKKYWDEGSHAGCNHFSWSGGEEVLLDTLNNVLVENFTYDKAINFYSLEKSSKPSSNSTRKEFVGTDGLTYSFMDFETEFRQWLTDDLLVNLTKEKLVQASYHTLTWESATGWSTTIKEQFIKDNFAILKRGLLEIAQPNCDYFISQDGLNPFMFEGVEFDTYFNNCRESKDWQYPTMTIVISHQSKKSFTQNHFEFLRTDAGYRLICVTIRNEKVKG